ncbi:hypothetical protein PFISCL1PPCAC_3892, partial [Pristionchus fissidentatus]
QPPTLEQFIDLQEKLKKKEALFQRLCRSARESELRAERAESRLDSAMGMKENGVSLKLKNEKLEKIVSELTDLLEMERENSKNFENVKLKNEQLKVEKENLKDRVFELTELLNKEREISERNKARAEKLSRRVVELENEKSGEKEVKIANPPVVELDKEEEEEEEEKKEEKSGEEEKDEKSEDACESVSDTVPSIDPLSVLIPYKKKSGRISNKELAEIVSRLQKNLQ